jgi:hypothetical protein
MKRICENCTTSFDAKPAEVNRGGGRFCSISCSSSRTRQRTQDRTPNTPCAYCGSTFWRKQSRPASKSGLYYCCREHKDLAKRGTGRSGHRTIAFHHYAHICARCGYEKEPRILEVHHLDHDHSNNDVTNLQIVCPTCHALAHL